MTAEEVYDQLFATPGPVDCDAFDRHVVAAILSLAVSEGLASGQGPLPGLGLAGPDLGRLLRATFPGIEARFSLWFDAPGPDVDKEEQSVRDILGLYCSQGDGLERALGAMIARRCKFPHHLWQDLGLRNRGELSTLMKRHFEPLAQKNRNDMKWKKFLYRMVCGSEGFTLCTAPVCAECDDFHVCFGAEDGESRLAWMRNGRRVSAAVDETALPEAAE
ncbi:nitrogen fixation protein NifQ [Xanthobacter sp. V4C-4]|uniref:nitrogen fixation protein NifQ n=1 Tax=Xanthobacter cornucopiae TaxID=3119924 RepID=UPI00372AEF2C